MPPKSKRGSKSCTQPCSKNPRVILRPLLADTTGHGRYRFTTLPASANLFNKPELSDLNLRVGEHVFHTHKLILCASSDVFRNMFDERWCEQNHTELKLEEEEDCSKHFHRFLQYMYTGSVIISESYVIPLFMLADKYNVRPLYTECVKIIERGLKVYLVQNKSQEPLTFTSGMPAASSVSTESSSGESSDEEFSDGRESPHLPHYTHTSNPSSPADYLTYASPYPSSSQQMAGDSRHAYHQVTAGSVPTAPPIFQLQISEIQGSSQYLVASETFPLNTVMKVLTFCHNDRIQAAALYNLEARLSKLISSHNYGVWNDLPQQLLLELLKDTHFYVGEFTLFRAARAWLVYSQEREGDADTVTNLLTHIRYPVMTPQELYTVEHDELVASCPQAKQLVSQAIRYQLFRGHVTQDPQWSGDLYTPRCVKYEH